MVNGKCIELRVRAQGLNAFFGARAVGRAMRDARRVRLGRTRNFLGLPRFFAVELLRSFVRKGVQLRRGDSTLWDDDRLNSLSSKTTFALSTQFYI